MDADVAAALASFLGEQPFAPPPPSPVDGRGDGLRGVGVVVDDGPFPGAARLLRRSLWRAGAVDGGELAVSLVPDRALGPEAFQWELDGGQATVAASAPAGMAYGVTEVRARLAAGDRGGSGEGSPALGIRLLSGWGIHQSDRWDDVLEVAIEGRANRVLCNWWAAGAGDELGAADAAAVTAARELGIEAVFELRRQVLGPNVSLRDQDALRGLLAHYDAAVDAGFRSFGLLFDDTDHDPFEDELAVLDLVRSHLQERLGEEAELFFCPRFYWFPGQADYSWMGGGSGIDKMFGGGGPRTVAEATERQTEYLEALAGHLGPKTHVYLANWWSAVPADAGEQVRERFSALIGRPPIFWDNQLQNDFRAAAIHPLASHQRTPGFADALAGFCLNAPWPLAPHATAAVTAMRWAWDPAGYDPAAAHRDAIAALWGPAAPEAHAVLVALGDLLGQLSAPRAGTETHLRGVRRTEPALLDGALDDLADLVAACAAALDERRPALCRLAVADWAREVDRLRLDLALAADPSDEDAWDALAAILVERLPAAPGLADLVAQGEGADWSGVSGSSWYLHFVEGPLRATRRAFRPRT